MAEHPAARPEQDATTSTSAATSTSPASRAGRVVVDGTDLTALSPSGLREARRGIGMVFQHFNLVHHLTAAQNVALALKFAGVDRRARQARALEI